MTAPAAVHRKKPFDAWYEYTSPNELLMLGDEAFDAPRSVSGFRLLIRGGDGPERKELIRTAVMITFVNEVVVGTLPAMLFLSEGWILGQSVAAQSLAAVMSWGFIKPDLPTYPRAGAIRLRLQVIP
jgi:hypothetical protein